MKSPDRHFATRPGRLLLAAGLALMPLLGHAAITDPVGDFLPTFGGSKNSADLDVLSASVVFNPSADSFILSATLNGAPGTTPGGFYVWGVDTGKGTNSFAANGLPGVVFDQVVLLRPNGVSAVGGTNLAPGAVTIAGNTISAVVSGLLLPSTGFSESAYTWNLWPRDANAVGTGFAQISDFAPDNSMFAATLAVPEPHTYALMLAGLVAVGWVGKRRKT
jgi:PEP-CTERM motif